MSNSSREFSANLRQKTLNVIGEKYKTILNSLLDNHKSLIGTAARNFVLETPKGGYIELDDFANRPIYLSFWFTGCLPCIKAFPKENQLIDKLADTDLQFIRICTNSQKDDWLEKLQDYNLKSLNLYADETWSKLLKDRYSLTAYPKYLIIDRSGVIVDENGLSPDNKNIMQKLSKVL